MSSAKPFALRSGDRGKGLGGGQDGVAQEKSANGLTLSLFHSGEGQQLLNEISQPLHLIADAPRPFILSVRQLEHLRVGRNDGKRVLIS